MSKATSVSFPFIDRVILAMTYAGNEPKDIADRIDHSRSAVDAHLNAVCETAGVTRAQLRTWLFLNPEAMVPGGSGKPGLHPKGCGCTAEFCTMLRRSELTAIGHDD